MSRAAPSSMTLIEKRRLFEQEKYDTFRAISQDKATIFNYFMVNNDIFHMISKEDEFQFKYSYHYVRGM
jgi:hypothetical protein